MQDTFFKFLGMLVWTGGKVYLRQRYGRTYVPKPLLAAAIAGGLALAVLAVKRNGTSD
jgi:hypothetical protein